MNGNTNGTKSQRNGGPATKTEPKWLPVAREVIDFIATAGASLVRRP